MITYNFKNFKNIDIEKILNTFRAKNIYEKVAARIYLLLGVFGSSFLIATMINTALTLVMIKQIRQAKPRVQSLTVENPLSGGESVNLRDVKKFVMERNIFNSEGKFPHEKALDMKQKNNTGFSLDAPCQEPTLKITLVGTIYLGNSQTSLATVRENGYDEADIYRVGDQIIGSEGAYVAAVERQKLIVNNAGTKECFDLAKESEKILSNIGVQNISSSGSSGSDVTLESSYVEAELGPGFGKIIDAARLVPNITDGAMNGFKIFAIKPDSLLARAGLQNGDVITQVNEANLTQPEQGFALYQALQDEKQLQIKVLRNGTTPTTLNVRIK